MAIHNIQEQIVERVLKFVICEKCGKKILGTSDAQLKTNIQIHNIFCGRKNK